MQRIHAVTMPKWGLSMDEGQIISWRVPVGTAIAQGDALLDVETSKIVNSVEAPVDGTLRHIVVDVGETALVGRLLGVITVGEVPDDEVAAFVARHSQEADANAPSEAGPGDARVIEYDGASISYLDVQPVQSQGYPLVFIHGFGADANGWLLNIGTLSSARRVIALDLPGHGRSSKSVGTGGLTELARGLFALLDQLEIDKAHLVGHSMGGALAMHVAREHRARVQSLTLAAPLGLGENIDRDFIESFVTAQSRRELQRVVGKLFRDKSLIGAEMLEGLQRYKRIDGVSEALATIAGALFSGGRQQVRFDPNMLDGIPTLVIWGSADEVLDSSQAPAPRANLRVEMLDDVGHVPHLEAAGTFNRLVAEHVAASER